jgi:hypothetical protein
LAVSDDGKTLFAANAGNNAVAMIDLVHPENPPFAFIPAGGFPGAVCTRGNELFIGNVLAFKGGLQKVAIPIDESSLKRMTTEARNNFHLTEILRSQALAQNGVMPKPVPENVGEPSTIRHVVYILKENKKFDQVLGDIGRGNCDKKLCEFPRAVTPNAHALADEFVVLDNYYCNGIKSCDGHQWATQGLTTPYREKDWANVHCTYDFLIDPLCYAGCGFIWDHVIRHGLSFRNFGEGDYPIKVKGKTWADFYDTWKNKSDKAAFKCNYSNDALRRYSDLRFPGWELDIPDVFLTALKEFEQVGSMPNLCFVYLPNDHTNGKDDAPTPRAYVADNDLAMGRVLEALSKSRFWKDMTVFINEDDPASGTDHVDGHRSICLLAGPYVKRGGAVVSRFYNQTSVLHTICRILGTPPMNQAVAASPIMTECFQVAPDITPFICRPVTIPLDEFAPAPSKTHSMLVPLIKHLDFSAPDRLDKDTVLFSRYVWSTVRGDEPFPVDFAGSHGKGLKALGLEFSSVLEDGDD